MSAVVDLPGDPALGALRAMRSLTDVMSEDGLLDALAHGLCAVAGFRSVGFRSGERWLRPMGPSGVAIGMGFADPLGAEVHVVADRGCDDALVPWVAELLRAAEAMWRSIGTFGALETLVAEEMATVVQREASIQLILDSMGDGLLVCQPDGGLTEIRSAAATRWFGEPTPAMKLWDYLFPGDAIAAGTLQLGVEQLVDGFFPFDVAADQIASRFHREDHWFGLAFEPVLVDGDLTGLVVTVSDADALVKGERAEADSRELIEVVRQVVVDPSEARASVVELRRLVAALDGPRRASVLLDLHTLKGGAAVMGLRRLSMAAHAAEDRLSEGVPLPAAVADVQQEAEATFARIEPVMGSTDVLQIQRANIDELLEQLGDGHELLSVVRSWHYPAMTSLLRQVTHGLDGVGSKLGKQVTVQLGPTHLHAASDAIERTVRALSHITRNAVAHGIETVEERLAAGKAAAGTLRVGCWEASGCLVVRISDDGAGIDWRTVAARAVERGLPHATRDDLVQVLLMPGVSTRDCSDELSGRGQGMAAVVQALDALGGRLELESERGVGTTWTLHMPKP